MNAATKTNAMNVKRIQVSNDLRSLKTESGNVSANLKRSRESLHLHLSAIYLWWREAKEISGYLDGEYKKLVNGFRTIKYDPNFIPLIWLVWGVNADMNNQYADRYSRALWTVHQEFKKNPKKYEKDGKAKLADFIKQSGGVTKLAGYAPKGEIVTSNENNPNASDMKAANDEMIKVAFEHANTYSIDQVTLTKNVSTNENAYTLLLVKTTNQGSALKATSIDNSLIETVLAEHYRRQFDATQSVVRPLLELIQTQCYPKHLAHISPKMMKNNKKEEMTSGAFRPALRVVYLHEKNQFMLSLMNVNSGVVSLVTPDVPILKGCDRDVFMPLYQRAILESNFLQGFDFNLYRTNESPYEFDSYGGDNSASHTLKLRHLIEKDKADRDKVVDLHFWPFYGSFPQPIDQVEIDQDYSVSPDWEANLPHSWFHELSKKFLDPWLNSHAKHLGRDKHMEHRVTFWEDQLDIEYYYRNGKFDCLETIDLGNKVTTHKSIMVQFRSQDWVLAVKSVDLLPIVGGVSVSVNSDKMVIRFKTKGGLKHEIHIPTVNEEYNRCTVPFSAYQPKIVSDVENEILEPEDNDLEALAASWSEAGGASS